MSSPQVPRIPQVLLFLLLFELVRWLHPWSAVERASASSCCRKPPSESLLLLPMEEGVERYKLKTNCAINISDFYHSERIVSFVASIKLLVWQNTLPEKGSKIHLTVVAQSLEESQGIPQRLRHHSLIVHGLRQHGRRGLHLFIHWSVSQANSRQ